MMGNSGGRSAGNRTGDGARRRNTPRERSYIDPPMDQATEIIYREAPADGYRLTPRGERAMTAVAVLSSIGMMVLMAFVLYQWWMA